MKVYHPDYILKAMHHNLEVATDPWGVHVERVEIKVGTVQKLRLEHCTI